jgi:hypothetical protein
MQLTTTQLASLNAAVKADVTASVYLQNRDVQSITDYFNTVPSSGTVLWKNDVKATSLPAIIDWTEFVTLTVQQQNTFSNIVSFTQTSVASGIDATSANIRNAFSNIFAGKPNTLANLVAVSQRTATRFEAISSFITIVSGSVAVTSSVYGYVLSTGDVSNALFNPDGSIK